MRPFIIAAMLAAGPAFAGDLVYQGMRNGSELRLLETPCSHGETLGHLKPEFRAAFKNIRAKVRGQIVYGCWIEEDDEAYVIMEDGSDGRFPLANFQDPMI